MIKKIVLLFLFLSFFACNFNPKAIDPSINLADRHVWLPADEEDLEKRRLLQIHLDSIANEVEKLFLNVEDIDPKELDMRLKTNDVISEVGSLKSNRSNQIESESKRINKLNKELKNIRLNQKQINKQVVNLNLAPVFTKKEYSDAFYYFRKGQYIKSANLFKNLLVLHPPHLLVDNILFGLSMSYFKINNYPKAITSLSRVIDGFPGSDKWYMSIVMLALIHEETGEKSQAIYILEKGLKNNPPYFIRSVINKLINLVQNETIPPSG